MLLSKRSPFYGPHILFDADGKSGGGDGENGDQTNWQDKYEALKAEINEKYVPRTSYVSLQQNLQKAVDAKAEAEGIANDAQTKLVDLKSQFDGLNTEYESLKTSSADSVEKLAKLESGMSRTALILKDFPGLAAFEGKGLIPDATPEELPELLKKYQENLDEIQKEGRKDFKKGETPPPPPPVTPDGKKGSAALMEEALQLQREYKFDDYEKKMNEYYAAVQREEKAS